MKTLTIFTPTYNRAYILDKLYQSLVSQTCQDFQWLVVDDGSTDNTKELLLRWEKEHKVDMLYISQENGGKMRAHNVAVKHANSELFMCCDSDDYMTTDAVEVILNKWNSYYGSKDNISGLISPTTIICKGYEKNFSIPQNLTLTTLKELHNISDISEAHLILRTEILHQYPFQLQDDEKFVTEDSVFHLLDRKYKMIYLSNKTVIAEYLSDGYTMNLQKVMEENPKGYAYYYNLLSEDETNPHLLQEYLKQYILFSRMAGFPTIRIIFKSAIPYKTAVRMLRMNIHKMRSYLKK